MIGYIYTILKSNNPGVSVFQVLILLFIIYVLYLIIIKYKKKERTREGFTQNERFVYKKNNKIYDNFYSQIYDEIHIPEQRVGYELMNIIKITQPSSQNSVFLDVGSGTGHLVNELKEAGYTAYGLDKSKSMIEHSEEKFPKCQYKCGDAKEPMLFEKGVFTHIISTYFTLYQMKDKRTFLQNCHNWLMPNGYLIIHLVDKQKFDTLVPASRMNAEINPHKYASSRLINSKIEFPGFDYKSIYKFNKDNIVNHIETFKDNKTNNIRQNEQTLYMEEIEEILEMLSTIGFTFKGMFDMKKSVDDEFQYVYILEKI